MPLQVCSGYRSAPHVEVTYNSDGAFCPVCEAIEDRMRAEDERDEAKENAKQLEREIQERRGHFVHA